MVTADQRSPSPTENFVLFPFTHPALVRRREAGDLCLPLEISTTTGNMVINDVNITSMTHGKVPTVDDSRICGIGSGSAASKLSYGTNLKENRIDADFGRSGGLNENEKAKNVDYLFHENKTDEFHDFAREHLNAFDDSGQTAHNVMSRESMLVQVGRPDTDEVEQSFDEVEEEETSAMADLSSDTVFGPAFSVELDHTVAEPPPLVALNETVSKGYILMLETKLGMNRSQFQNQQRAIMLFNARNVPYKTLDGSDSTNKEIRNELFKLSDLRGAYPQFFLVRSSSNDELTTTTFLGDWETIEGINDSSSLPAELLEANPTLVTWNRIPGLSFKLA